MGHLALYGAIWLEVSIIAGMTIGTILRAMRRGEL